MASQENLYKLVLCNLVSTTKTVVEKYELVKAYGVRIALIMIKNKRIALN